MLILPSSFAREHCPEPGGNDLNVSVRVPALQRTFSVRGCWQGTRKNSEFAFLAGWQDVVAAGGFQAGQQLRLTVLRDGSFSVEPAPAEAVKDAEHGGGVPVGAGSPSRRAQLVASAGLHRYPPFQDNGIEVKVIDCSGDG